MPPCQRVLLQKIKRAKLVATRWYSAIRQFETNLSPLQYGWELTDGQYALKWYEGEAYPRTLDITIEDDVSSNGDEDELDDEQGMEDLC